jgi:hypothetical protein
MAIAIILLLALVALAWLIYEPISGIMGATFIGKVVAVIAAFKILGWAIGAILGPAVRSIH